MPYSHIKQWAGTVSHPRRLTQPISVNIRMRSRHSLYCKCNYLMAWTKLKLQLLQNNLLRCEGDKAEGENNYNYWCLRWEYTDLYLRYDCQSLRVIVTAVNTDHSSAAINITIQDLYYDLTSCHHQLSNHNSSISPTMHLTHLSLSHREGWSPE